MLENRPRALHIVRRIASVAYKSVENPFIPEHIVLEARVAMQFFCKKPK